MASSDLATEVRGVTLLHLIGYGCGGHTQGPGTEGGVLLGRHISRIPVQMETLQRGVLLKVRDWERRQG